MKKIKLVKQEHDKGCAVACLAMVTGKTYAAVESDFLNNFDVKGIYGKDTIKYLAYCGFSIIRKRIQYVQKIEFGRDELLKPFADVHIVTIQQCFDSKNTHTVVMDAKGEIFCPAGVSDEAIRRAYFIEEIIGIYK